MKSFLNDKDGLSVSDTIALAMAAVVVGLWLGILGKLRGPGLGEVDIELARDVMVPLTLGLMAVVAGLRALKLPVRLKRAAENGGNGNGNGKIAE